MSLRHWAGLGGVGLGRRGHCCDLCLRGIRVIRRWQRFRGSVLRKHLCCWITLAMLYVKLGIETYRIVTSTGNAETYCYSVSDVTRIWLMIC
jgi:hypothetical protein